MRNIIRGFLLGAVAVTCTHAVADVTSSATVTHTRIVAGPEKRADGSWAINIRVLNGANEIRRESWPVRLPDRHVLSPVDGADTGVDLPGATATSCNTCINNLNDVMVRVRSANKLPPPVAR